MTIATLLVVVAALALLFLLSIPVSRSLQASASRGLAAQIQPLDVEAFRNLVDPAEDEFLRRRLKPADFRMVRRRRLLAMAVYVRTAGKNAAVLVSIGQAAFANDAQTAEAAHRLVDNALLLRRNAAFALVRIYFALAWPGTGLAAAPVLQGYEQLNGAAMLLGRLQNPAKPVRISATY